MNPACFLDINVLFRLWHVYIHQTVWAIPERESLRLPSDGFWFHQSQEGVCQTSSLLKLLSLSNLTHSWVWFFLLIVTCAISNGCSFLLSYAFSAEGVMRTMTTEKLLKGMPVLQTQIDTLLEFDVSQMLTRLLHLLDRCSITRQEVPLLFLLAGSSQGAEQRDHQCCIYASLQGPGQTVCILQWRNHQPIRLVVPEELLIYTAKM